MQTRTDNSVTTDEQTLERWLEAARATGVQDSYTGKRAHPRTSWNEPVTVELMGMRRPQRPLYGYTRDIGVGGIGLRCHERVEPLSQVRVTLDETGESLCGTVRHCSEGVGSFLVGIEFELRPKHQSALRKSA